MIELMMMMQVTKFKSVRFFPIIRKISEHVRCKSEQESKKYAIVVDDIT